MGWLVYKHYARGSRFSDRTSIWIIDFEKNQCFTVVKWGFLMPFISYMMCCNDGSIFFGPSKLRSFFDHHNMFFWCVFFPHWNYEVDIKDHWKRV